MAAPYVAALARHTATGNWNGWNLERTFTHTTSQVDFTLIAISLEVTLFEVVVIHFIHPRLTTRSSYV